MTEINYAVLKHGSKDETVYFADNKVREDLKTKQKKLIAGRGLKLTGNTLSLADNIGGGSKVKYLTVEGLKLWSYYDGAEIYELDGSQYAKATVEFAYLGNPAIFKDYADLSDDDRNGSDYSALAFISEVDYSFEANKQKAVEAISKLESTDDDYFCLFPLKITSGDFVRNVSGYNGSSELEACVFADWYYDSYGVKQHNYSDHVEASCYTSSIMPIIWKMLAE